MLSPHAIVTLPLELRSRSAQRHMLAPRSTLSIAVLVATALGSLMLGYVAVKVPIRAIALAPLPLILVLAARSDWAFTAAVVSVVLLPHQTHYAWLLPPLFGAALVLASVRVHPPLGTLDVLFGFWIAILALSWKLHPELLRLANQIDPADAPTTRMFLQYWLPALFFVWARLSLGSHVSDRWAALRRIQWTFFTTGTIAAATVIFEWWHGSVIFHDAASYTWQEEGWLFRAGGVFAGAPPAGIALSMIVVGSSSLLRERRRIVTVGIGIMLFAIAVTYSRAPLVGLAVGALTCIFLLPSRQWGRLAYAVTIAAFIAVIIGPAIVKTQFLSESLIRPGSAASRVSFLSQGMKLVDDSSKHLIFGRGFFSFTGPQDVYGFQPHNEILRSVLEQGLIGSIFLLAFLSGCLIVAIRAARAAMPGSAERASLASLTGATVVYLVSGMWHDVSHNIPCLAIGMAMFGLVVTAARWSRFAPVVVVARQRDSLRADNRSAELGPGKVGPQAGDG